MENKSSLKKYSAKAEKTKSRRTDEVMQKAAQNDDGPVFFTGRSVGLQGLKKVGGERLSAMGISEEEARIFLSKPSNLLGVYRAVKPLFIPLLKKERGVEIKKHLRMARPFFAKVSKNQGLEFKLNTANLEHCDKCHNRDSKRKQVEEQARVEHRKAEAQYYKEVGNFFGEDIDSYNIYYYEFMLRRHREGGLDLIKTYLKIIDGLLMASSLS